MFTFVRGFYLHISNIETAYVIKNFVSKNKKCIKFTATVLILNYYYGKVKEEMFKTRSKNFYFSLLVKKPFKSHVNKNEAGLFYVGCDLRTCDLRWMMRLARCNVVSNCEIIQINQY